MLMSSCHNRVKATSDNLNQSTTTAEVEESVQDVTSDRIIYSPNDDIVDEEGAYIDEPLDTNAVYIVVEDMPEFPGGTSAILDYLSKNVRYPEACLKDSIQGRVIIYFVVERDGRISNAEVIKSVHEQLDAEALRVVRAMPKWNPGRQRGVALRVRYGIPVNFRLEDFKIPVEWIDYDEAEDHVESIMPGTIISGIVLDASTGEPISNALIVETVENDSAAYYYTRTDRDGRFSYPLFGTGHVLKVMANQRVYKSVKIPLDNMTTYEIKLEKDPDGDGGDGVMYTIGPFDMLDEFTPEGREKRRSGTNIRVVKPGELIDDGEGILIE